MTDLQTPTTAAPAELTGPAPQEAIHHKATGADRARSALKHALMIAASLIMIYPLLWLIASSFRPNDLIFRTPGIWVTDLYVENYTQGWFSLSNPFSVYIINSAIVVIGAIAGNLFACTLAVYAFARLQFRGREKWFSLVLATMMVPVQVTIVPVFMLIRGMGLSDTLLALILPAVPTAFGTFLMRQYFLGLPVELGEAAAIDGAGPWRRFVHITLPLMRPLIAIQLLFGVIYSAYQFAIPYVMLGSNPGPDADLMMTLIVRQSFSNNLFGFGAAASVLLMLAMAVWVALWYATFRRDLQEAR